MGRCSCRTFRTTINQSWQVPLSEEEEAAQKAKPEKMAIGGDGGFQVRASLLSSAFCPPGLSAEELTSLATLEKNLSWPMLWFWQP